MRACWLAAGSGCAHPPARPDDPTPDLRGMLARRRHGVEIPTADPTRWPSTAASPRAEVEAPLAYLETQRAALDAAVAWTVQASPAGPAQEPVRRSIPGGDPGVARPVLAARPALSPLTRQEAAARAGVAPLHRASGRSPRRRCIGGGRGGVPAQVSMAAVTAVRGDPALQSPCPASTRGGCSTAHPPRSPAAPAGTSS